MITKTTCRFGRAGSAGFLNTSGAIFCWGADTYGALGNGTFNASEIPAQVLGIGGNGLLQL
jgi:Regulator of chromosome condensation (RCC1) repeat